MPDETPLVCFFALCGGGWVVVCVCVSELDPESVNLHEPKISKYYKRNEKNSSRRNNRSRANEVEKKKMKKRREKKTKAKKKKKKK